MNPKNPNQTVSLRRAKVLVAAVGLAAVGPSVRAMADPAAQPPLGARGVALGGAFSALADDATSIFWNPAGLTHITHQEFVGTYANLFATDIRDNQIAYALPLSPRQVVAFDWYHSGFDDNVLSFGENRFDLAYAFRFNSLLSVGATGKYVRRDLSLDGQRVEPAAGSGYGMDFGVQVSPIPSARLGVLVQDAFDTRVESDDGSSDVAFPRNVRVGAAWLYGDRLAAALDVDDRWHLGVEGRVVAPLTLRAGVQDDWDTNEGAVWSGGFGVAWGPLRFDYAREDHPVLAATNHYTVSFAFNFNPALVRIENVEVSELFASLHKSYAHQAFGSAGVRNLRDQPLEVRLRVHVPGYMDEPSEQTVVLRPKALQRVALTGVFSEDIMATSSDRPVQVVVSANYRSLRLPRTETSAARTVAYGPGAIDWGRGVDQAAAYVTTRDPQVADFARGMTRFVDASLVERFGNRTVAHTATLFEALDVLGVSYVPDPNNPYAVMSTTPHAVDTVHYPRTTLTRRVGDCDDTSVLMAALLGNIGIATRLVDVPEHLFLLVDTGVAERNPEALGLPVELYVPADGRLWMPLETTAIGRGFTRAWEEGAERYRDYDARGRLAHVDVQAASATYPPAEPARDAAPLPSLDGALLRDRLQREASQVAAWRTRHRQERYGGLRDTLAPTARAWNKVAYASYLAGRYEAARDRLENILREDPESITARNNLAVVAAARGDANAALAHARTAAAASDAGLGSAGGDAPRDAGVLLNRGILELWTGDATAGATTLRNAVRAAGGYAPACALLGLSSDAPLGWHGAAELRALLRDIANSNAGVPARRVPLGPRTHELLYWKDARP